MQRYFVDENYQEKAEHVVLGEIFHHMIRVMRMSIDDQVFLVFKDQQAILAKVVAIAEDSATLVEVSKETMTKELPLAVTIASGFPKGDKLELIVQKGTELGASAFIGFPAQTSVVKWDAKKLAKKQERLQKIAQEAAEQSQRQVTPQVELLQSEKELVNKLADFDVVLVAYEESAKQGEKATLVKVLQAALPGQKLLVIFGPEGGVTPSEVTTFTEQGALLAALGPRILRTETAPFYLLSAVSYQFELLQ